MYRRGWRKKVRGGGEKRRRRDGESREEREREGKEREKVQERKKEEREREKVRNGLGGRGVPYFYSQLGLAVIYSSPWPLLDPARASSLIHDYQYSIILQSIIRYAHIDNKHTHYR